MSESTDVVVVGGGHNGLVAACFLAQAGLKVVVVEKEERLGGMALSAPLIAAAPNHIVNPGAYENVYLRAGGVVEDLQLARHGYREVDSAGWAWLGDEGESLLFQRDVDATVADIARYSRADADRYRELVAHALKLVVIQGRYFAARPTRPGWKTSASAASMLVRDRALRSTLGSLFTGTAVDAISSTFTSDQMRGAFASIATILGAPTSEGSALALLGTSALHYKGAARPIGGMGGLVTALERCLRAAGGEIRTGVAVASVESSGNRARSVVLADGTSITASTAIICAIPPQRTPDLVGDALPSGVRERLRNAPANAAGVATLTVNLALAGQVGLPQHQPHRKDVDLRKPALFTGTFDGVLAACADSAAGVVPAPSSWWGTIFTAMDPSQAPDGQDTVQLYSPVPVTAREGWDAARDSAANDLIAGVGKTISGLDLEIGRFVESPEDLSRRTGTVNGCLYHVDHLPTRMGPLRPALGAGGHKTSVDGLYLSGAGTHPSGGVSGLPGKHAAAAVLRDSKRHR